MDGTPFGRYRLIELLGRGGMGEVWRAFDTGTERVVALKVLPAQLADDETYQQRFRREARSAAGLDEPHVVPIYDFGEIEGRLFVTMRLIVGRDLQSMLREGPLDPARAVHIIDQVASALNAAHRIDLVHRDVKPSNILVAEDDFAYLIDFGIARSAGETSLTSTGNVIGSWAYLAPERMTRDSTDHRADIYALTCVMHECLTGSQPFPGDSLEQQLGGHLTQPPPRPSVLRHGLPAQLDAVVAKGMAKNPDDRYDTTKELTAAARAAITGPPTGPQPVMTPQPIPPGPGGVDPRFAPAAGPWHGAPAAAPWPPPGPRQQPVAFAAGGQVGRWQRHAVAVTAGCAVVAVAIAVPIIFVATGSSEAAGPALLSVQQVNNVMGEKNYRLIDSARKLTEPGFTVTPQQCGAIQSIDMKAAFAAVGINTADSQTLHATGNDIRGSVDQYLANAPSVSAANRFLQQRLQAWRSCNNLDYSAGGVKMKATIVADGRTKISAQYHFVDDSSFLCQQNVATSDTAIATVIVCDNRAGVESKADTLVSKILAAS